MSDLISRQAAIDAMTNSKSNLDITLVPGAYTDGYSAGRKNMLNELLQVIYDLPPAQSEQECEKCIFRPFKQFQPEQRWIPCSERLPEQEKKSYWVCTDGGYQCQCRWTNINHFWTDLTTDWHWHIMDVPQYSKVVAWMPLPEPMREGE